jgi:hypothetical protein
MTRATAMLTAVLLTVGLGGCASSPVLEHVGMGVGTFTTDWDVGSCHRLDQPAQTDPMMLSDTSPAVPCQSEHQSETYAVVPITGAVAAPDERPSPLWLRHAVDGACKWSDLGAYLGATDVDIFRDIVPLQILPSADEWRAGIRQVRCDALVGPRTTASVASVAVPLKQILRHPAGARYRVCSFGDVEVTCDQPHNWELVYPYVKFTATELKADRKTKEAEVAAACAGRVTTYLGTALADRPDLVLYREPPPGDGPHAGAVSGFCWIGPKSKAKLATGTLRAMGSVQS